MTSDVPLPTGKLPPSVMARLLRDLGHPPPEVLLGPSIGEDACAIDLPAGVLVAATDPVTLTGQDAGRYAVTVNANDVAVTGVQPRWFLSTLLLPLGTSEAAIKILFAQMQTGLDRDGIALVGGHIEITDAVTRPVVVGQMLGLADNHHFVRTGGARPGQAVLQVGPAPIEGAAVLAAEAGELLAGLDPQVLNAAKEALDNPGISVVQPALLATRLGATALHDPTEGGLAAGLHELALASGVRLRVDRQQALWWEPGLAVCQAVGADPWATLASGTLLAVFDQAATGAAAEAFSAAGHPAGVIAIAEDGDGVIDTDGEPFPWPGRDELSRVLEQRNRRR